MEDKWVQVSIGTALNRALQTVLAEIAADPAFKDMTAEEITAEAQEAIHRFAQPKTIASVKRFIEIQRGDK